MGQYPAAASSCWMKGSIEALDFKFEAAAMLQTKTSRTTAYPGIQKHYANTPAVMKRRLSIFGFPRTHPRKIEKTSQRGKKKYLSF